MATYSDFQSKFDQVDQQLEATKEILNFLRAQLSNPGLSEEQAAQVFARLVDVSTKLDSFKNPSA